MLKQFDKDHPERWRMVLSKSNRFGQRKFNLIGFWGNLMGSFDTHREAFQFKQQAMKEQEGVDNENF